MMTTQLQLEDEVSKAIFRDLYQGRTITKYIANRLDELSSGLSSGELDEVRPADLEVMASILSKVSDDLYEGWETMLDLYEKQGADAPHASV